MGDKKVLSKQLLSQIHFCRFIYKLLLRIKDKIDNNISEGLKNQLISLIFGKLTSVKSLEILRPSVGKLYRKTSDY